MVLQLKVLPTYGVGIEKQWNLDNTTTLVVGGEGLFNGQSQLRVEVNKRYLPTGTTIRLQLQPSQSVGVEKSFKINENTDMTIGGDAMLSGKSSVRLAFQRKISFDTGLFEDWVV
eukprot:tig00020938_g16136.t1